MKGMGELVNSGLTHYLEEAKRFSMLTVEHEQKLARAWRDHGDREALRLLVGSHLRLVVKIARSYAGYGLAVDDLIAEGNAGLMQAAQKFDPDRGFRFATYALWWIKAAIQEYVLHNRSLVKMGTTAAQKKLFFNLSRLKGRLQAVGQGDLPPETVATIAAELNVPEAEVIDMNRRMAAADGSLNTPVGEGDESEWLDLLADEQPNQETLVADAEEYASRSRLLNQAMKHLNERERRILIERRLKEAPSTLEELGQEFRVSRERIRQIEVRALEKLRKAVLNATQAAERPGRRLAA
jgi:RNA polymerase sigma-32 factor